MTPTLVDRPSTSPPIDRRIRARRIEVRRTEGRRRLRRLAMLLGASALVLVAWGIVRSPLLDVDQIHIAGAERTTEEQILTALAVERGDALVDVDVDAAGSSVATLPWIASVAVERTWGGAVDVEVVERDPDAVTRASDGSAWLVDVDGTVLGPADDVEAASSDGLMVVEGLSVPAPGDVIDPADAAALTLAVSVPESVRPLVAAVEVDGDAQISLRLLSRPGEVDADGVARLDGGHVRLGDGRSLEEQVRSLTAVLEQVDLTDLVEVDVRVPANPVVSRTAVPGGDGVPTEGAG